MKHFRHFHLPFLVKMHLSHFDHPEEPILSSIIWILDAFSQELTSLSVIGCSKEMIKHEENVDPWIEVFESMMIDHFVLIFSSTINV
jgi:hypothetical protein